MSERSNESLLVRDDILLDMFLWTIVKRRLARKVVKKKHTSYVRNKEAARALIIARLEFF